MKNIVKVWRSSAAFLLSAFSFLILITSCSNELDETLQPVGNGNLQFVVGDFPAFGEGAATRAIGFENEGKTAWEDNDKILVHLYSQEYGNQAVELTFRNGDWKSDGGTLSYLKDENPTITAVYAPDCEIKEGQIVLQEGKQYGMAEYILANATINGNTIDIRFESGRTYSRLRIATMPGATLTVTTGYFTPAGPNGTTAPESYTLTADDKGNAYLYGTFAAEATVSVMQGDVTLKDYTFTAEKYPNGTEAGKSYALDATPKYFSVSASNNVIFAPGNLQYHPANNKWRFAENQTDYLGEANTNISDTYNDWIDLFGWSGNEGSANFGVSALEDHNYYKGAFVDWGTNQIGNDVPNTWRTLSKDEWVYLFQTRTNASSLYGVAQVRGVNGIVVLPDNWSVPSGLSFISGLHSSAVSDYSVYQSFTTEQWQIMEQAGAVFLPASGDRSGTEMSTVGSRGNYWSSTKLSINASYLMYFTSSSLDPQFYWRIECGYSVRLVKDLE